VTSLELPGVLSAADIARTADHLAGLQRPDGMIPWWPGGHCDPWNHVEAAMALDVVGRHDAAVAAYRWLASTQLPNGAWPNYCRSDGTIEDGKLDTNVCAYIATGVYHHWLSTGARDVVRELWPVVERAMAWVLSLRRNDGLALWAIEADGSRPWDYALLTGSSSIAHALVCGARLGRVIGRRRPHWERAAVEMRRSIAHHPERFEGKPRWAMDWYYPVLTGALPVSAGKVRLADGWDTFVIDGRGVRCVSDEPWVTASATAECVLAYAAIGDTDTAVDLVRWTTDHRRPDGAYWTGIVYPERIRFPSDEHTSYTAAAIVLAADAITDTSPAARVFRAPADLD
jgi:MMP endo-(1,4)-3-O-methyl-alpha-D-mannosidase